MEISPKKCCIRYEPPTLVLFYEISSNQKLHRRSIPVKNDDLKEKKCEQYFQDLLTTHHEKYIKKFKKEQLLRLLEMLLKKSNGINTDLLSDDEKEPSHIDFQTTDLNKLDDEELSNVKEKMNVLFEQNQVKPGDEKWLYDVEVDFQEGKIETSAWDDDSDMEF